MGTKMGHLMEGWGNSVEVSVFRKLLSISWGIVQAQSPEGLGGDQSGARAKNLHGTQHPVLSKLSTPLSQAS